MSISVHGFAGFEHWKGKTSLKQKWARVERDYFAHDREEKRQRRGAKTGSRCTFQGMSQMPTSSKWSLPPKISSPPTADD